MSNLYVSFDSDGFVASLDSPDVAHQGEGEIITLAKRQARAVAHRVDRMVFDRENPAEKHTVTIGLQHDGWHVFIEDPDDVPGLVHLIYGREGWRR